MNLKITTEELVMNQENSVPLSAHFQIGYVSTESYAMTPKDLIALLEVSRKNNAQRDITGLLLYRETAFFQVLEGTEAQVKAAFEAISKDRRHHTVDVLFEGNTTNREFADWRMGFLNLDGVSIDQLMGYTNFLRRELEPREFLENLSRGKRLALMFRSME